MPFSSLIGNQPVRFALEKMIAHQAVPTTLLFEGPHGVGKRTFALAFAAQVMGKGSLRKVQGGIHPDLHVLTPEGKSHTHPIENLRKMIQEAYLPPLEADSKVFIIEEAEKMLPSSSNALLKILEEPPEKSYFILLTTEKEAILPTLLSRARKLSFFPLSQKEVETWLLDQHQLPAAKARQIAFLSHGSLGRAETMAKEKPFPWKEDLIDLLSSHVHREYPEFVKIAAKIDAHCLEAKEQETSYLLEEIAMWYRDLHLLAVDGGSEHLYHLESVDRLKQRLSYPIPPLERVLEGLAEVRLGEQRSIHFRHLLERFFIALS